MARFGLDFGTTTTIFADGSSGIPSIEAIGKPESWMYSRVKRGADVSIGDPEGQRSVKKYLFSKTRPKDGYENFEQDIELLFKEVISRTKKNNFDLTAQDSVLLGCPAIWDGEARATLLRIAKKANLGVFKETLLEEAVAAGISAIEANPSIGVDGKDILVYDLGGGTLDVAILRRDSFSNTLQVLASYGNAFAGDTIDESLLEILSNRAGVEYLPLEKRAIQDNEKSNSRIFEQNELIRKKQTEINAALTRIETAKKLLSDPKTKMQEVEVELVSIPLTKVKLTRADLEAACAEVIRISKLEVERALILSNMWDLVKKREKTEVLVSHLLEQQRIDRIEGNKPRWDVQIRQDWLNDPEHNYTWARDIQRAREIDYSKIGTIVLAGGGSQLSEVANMLQRIFPSAEFFRGPIPLDKAGQTETNSSMNSIALGLASQNQFESLQFDRPSLNIDLVWSTGRTRLVEAYEQLWAPGEVDPRYISDPKKKSEKELSSRLPATNTTSWEANRIPDAAPVVRKLRIPLQDSDTPRPEAGAISVPSHGEAYIEFTRPSGKYVKIRWAGSSTELSTNVNLGMQTMRSIYYFWGRFVFFDGHGIRKSWYISDFGQISADEVVLTTNNQSISEFLKTCSPKDLASIVEEFPSSKQIIDHLKSFPAYPSRA